MSFDEAAVLSLYDKVVSKVMTLGIFEDVSQHEPKSPPVNGITAAVWVQSIAPVGRASGLSATSGIVTLYVRMYTNFLQMPLDGIDPDMLSAVSTVLNAFTGDYTLGGSVRTIDLLGMYGQSMGASAGYVEMNKTMYRTMTITLPVIVNDLWLMGGTFSDSGTGGNTLTVDTLAVTQNATVGTLTVIGSSTVDGNETVDGNLTVVGNAKVDGNLTTTNSTLDDGTGKLTTNSVATKGLDIASGAFSTTPFISSEDGTANTHGALIHVLGGNGTEFGHYLLWYDATDPAYLGLAMALGANHTYNGHPVIALGGYYNGWGVQGSSSSGGNPIFGVLNSAQSGNGLGRTSLTIYDNNTVVTLKNTLDDGSGNMTVAGGVATAVSKPATTYSIRDNDSTILSNGAATVTLPSTADFSAGRVYTIKNIAVGSVTVATTSSQTIDGATTYSLSAQYKYVTVQSDGSNWFVIGNN